MQARVVLATTAAAAVILSGCGSSGPGGKEKEADRAVADSSTVCADQATAAKVPASFPSAFPLPDGLVVTSSQTRSGGRVIVYGVSRDDVKTTLRFLQEHVPAAGFKLTEGEVEQHDAESNWSGRGYRGRWTIRELPQCHGNTLVTVLAAKGA